MAAVDGCDHGYIVESAAEKRLRLASQSIGGPVWLTRKLVEESGSEATVLSCYSPGSESVTHHMLVVDGATGAVGLHGRSSYPDLQQFVNAFQNKSVGSPAPLGTVVSKKNKELWRTQEVDHVAEEPTLGSLDDHNIQQQFSCPMCAFRDAAIELFTAHLMNSHTEAQRDNMRKQEQCSYVPVPRLGTNVHLKRAQKIELSTGSGVPEDMGFFLKLIYRSQIKSQTPCIFGCHAPEWNSQTFIAATDNSEWRVADETMDSITIELWRRNCGPMFLDYADELCASNSMDLTNIQYNESRSGTLELRLCSSGLALPVVIDYDVGFGREAVDIAQTQHIGPHRSHRDVYRTLKRKCKTKRQESVANLLLERLLKLLFEGPRGSSRKNYEKSLVPWVKDSLVPKCPDCGGAFGMKRRRHHCRLCGGVVCQTCSRALDAGEAAALVREAYAARNRLTASDLSTVIGECSIRVCSNCCQLCESEHGASMMFQNTKTLLRSSLDAMAISATYYDVLIKGLRKIHRDLEDFNELATRLRRFEGLSEFEKAITARQELLTDFATQDKLSKKLIVSAEGNFFQIFVKIHIRTVAELRNFACRLEDLPSADVVMSLLSQKKKLRNELQAQHLTSNLNDEVLELFEIQRWHPKLWFTGNALSDNDWQPWSSTDGRWGYWSRSQANPKSGFTWSGSWVQDFEGDEDGWMYSDKLTVEGHSWSMIYKRGQHKVRRRRYYRRMVPIVIAPAPTPKLDAPLSKRRSKSLGQRALNSKHTSSASFDQASPLPNNSANGEAGQLSAELNPEVIYTESRANIPDTNQEENIENNSLIKPRSDSLSVHDPKRPWISNEATSKCMLCGHKFTKLKRKHHCRHCGRVVCANCSKERTAHGEYQDKKKDIKKGVRTCDQCVQFQAQQSDSFVVVDAMAIDAVQPNLQETQKEI